MSKRIEGLLSINARGFGFAALDASDARGSAFVAPPDLNGYLAGDRVSGDIETSGGRHRMLNLKLLKRARTRLFGKIVVRRRRSYIAIDPQLSNTDWLIDGADDVDEGTWIIAKVDKRRARFERTVAPADASLERVIVRHGLRTDYPKGRPNVRLPGDEQKGRQDLRDMVTLTIDAPSSRDLDDAVAALPADPDGAVRVFVSIADVDALVPEGSDLDREARERATSVYLAGRVLPMLPPSLSEDALSVLPGKDRPALTAEMRIDPEGQVLSVDIYTSIIRSNARLSYAEVSDFLEHGDEQAIAKDLLPTLRWLRAAVARLDTVRSARGGVSLLRDEAYVHLDADTREPTDLSARPNNRAHALIERLMVATNEAVACWMHERGLPALYRVHDRPDEDSVRQLGEAARNFGLEAGFARNLSPRALAAFERQFEGRPTEPALRTVLAHMLGPARYTPEALEHFGLGAPLYLHFTSPIRRYADLVVHRIVKGYLRGNRDRHAGEHGLVEIGEHVTESARRATKAERERMSMVVARLFKQRIGDVLRGNVVAIKPFGLLVQLEGTGTAGTVALDQLPAGPYGMSDDGFALEGPERRFVIGEPLEVEVLDADEVLGRIELCLA